MFHICMVDGFLRSTIDVKGKPKDFKTKEDAEKWIKKNSYTGMSWKYEIYEDTVNR